MSRRGDPAQRRYERLIALIDAMPGASAPTAIDPAEVPVSTYGRHCSYVPFLGTRWWGFPTTAERDRFVSNYWDEGARVR